MGMGTPSITMDTSRDRGPSAAKNTLMCGSSATHFGLRLVTWRYAGAMRVHRSRLTILVLSAALAGCGGAKQDDPAAPDTAAPTEAQATTAPDVKVIQPGAPGEESKEVVP